jgi:transcription antitermination factor NusG
LIEATLGQFGWYAIRVKSNRENTVAASLGYRGYESFLPVYRARRQWSDRMMDVELPLFAGYVFCRLDPRARLPVLTIPGVVLFVGIGHFPTRIDDTEIANLQAIASTGLPAAPWPFLRTGQRVRIERGPLKDMEGLLIEIKNSFRLVVSVSLLQRSVSAEVDRDSITPLVTNSGTKSAVLLV